MQKQERAMPIVNVQNAAIGAAVLIGGVAIFQIALAIGLPLGEATMGGSAPTVDGVLSPAFRVVALLSAGILIGVAWVVLARAGVVSTRLVSDRALVWLTWGIVAFLMLNTVGNFSAPHPVERYVMGSITLLLVLLCGFVALRAPREEGQKSLSSK
jgi:hypothetical protein